jgi:thymidylate synthase ThyX
MRMIAGFELHCNELLNMYEKLVPLATMAVRKIVPYDDEAKDAWKKESSWESATEKRALDMVRDLLPMSVRTSFGITCSATALRELLDKRESSASSTGWVPDEVRHVASAVRRVTSGLLPTLVPTEPRSLPRQPMVPSQWSDRRTDVPMKVIVIQTPRWSVVEDATGYPIDDLMDRWTNHRHTHMPPDRSSELPVYIVKLVMPIAIHRDLGRHRMMTQLSSIISPTGGYGVDPLLGDPRAQAKHPELAIVAHAHRTALSQADDRLKRWFGAVTPAALQYACPMATMVNVTWVLNMRELIHVLGLRTTPQGHPSYRSLVQMLAMAIAGVDPVADGLIKSSTNWDNIIVGRPG